MAEPTGYVGDDTTRVVKSRSERSNEQETLSREELQKLFSSLRPTIIHGGFGGYTPTDLNKLLGSGFPGLSEQDRLHLLVLLDSVFNYGFYEGYDYEGKDAKGSEGGDPVVERFGYLFQRAD